MRRLPGMCGVRKAWGGGVIRVGLSGGLLMAGALLVWADGELRAQVTGQPPERKVEERPRIPEVERTGQDAAEHEVHRGDTLWDLAGRYLSNPFQWPRIFELNTDVVEDPHWIYPGERLRLPMGVAQDATRVAAEPAGPPAEPSGPTAEPAGPPITVAMPQEAAGRRSVSGFGGSSIFDESPSSGDVLGPLGVEELSPAELVSSSDFYRAPFLADRGSFGPVAMTARKIGENPLGLSLPPAIRRHHEVVLSLGGLQVAAGERLQAIRWARSLGDYGHIATPMAILEVKDVGIGSARAVVLDVFADYRVGDPVVRSGSFELDHGARLAPVESGMVARVIGFEVNQVLLGQGDMVFLDVGSGSGVQLGDEFAVFTAGEAQPAQADWSDRVAVVRVVRVQPFSATARVVDVEDVGVRPGSPARLVFRASEG